MRFRIGWVLVASLVMVACESPGDAPAAGTDTTTEAPDTTAATTTSTRALYSDDTPATTAPEAAQDTGATITIENFSFGAPLTVNAGDPVTVVNEDGVTHTWTSEDDVFDSGNLGSGDSFEYTFEDPGEYSFFCEIHPGMTGTITVTG